MNPSEPRGRGGWVGDVGGRPWPRDVRGFHERKGGAGRHSSLHPTPLQRQLTTPFAPTSVSDETGRLPTRGGAERRGARREPGAEVCRPTRSRRGFDIRRDEKMSNVDREGCCFFLLLFPINGKQITFQSVRSANEETKILSQLF